MTTLSQVKAQQPEWFSKRNKRFFGDIHYRILHGSKTKRPYLVRSTDNWSDMFGHQKQYFWRINYIDACLNIQSLVDTQFKTLEDVKDC